MGFFALIVLLVGFGLLKRFWRVVRSRDPEYILLSAAALAVLPAICNVTLLITSEATWHLQMAGALDLFIPLCILLLDVTRKEQPQNEKLRMAAIGGAVLLAGLIVYGNVYMRAVDQEAMYEGRKSLKTMTDRIADDLIDFGYFDGEERLPVVFVGRPSSNSAFLMREYYLYANTYAQIGRFWGGADVARQVWKSVFRISHRSTLPMEEWNVTLKFMRKAKRSRCRLIRRRGISGRSEIRWSSRSRTITRMS